MVGKLNRLKLVIKKLNREKFSAIKNKAAKAMELLLNFQARIQQSPSIELFNNLMQLAKQCEKLQKEKYQYLYQKYKVKWL